MQNLYVYFVVNLNLIFVAGKIFNAIDWSWLWVMSPLIITTVIGIFAVIGGYAKQNRMRSDIASTLTGLQDLVRKAKEKEKEQRANH